MEVKNIVVIGASAGGFEAITKLLSGLPADLPLAIMIVVHLSKNSSAAVLLQHLENKTSYKCRVPEDGEKILAGNLYLAPPDNHLFVKPGIIRLLKGAHENRWRPSVDVLFRSAAAAYGPRVIGIVLSGMMDDGTSGMSAINRCGGICIVQEPSEAEFADMPTNVLNNIQVDHQVPVADIGYILDDIISKPVKDHEIPESIKMEAAITERMNTSIKELENIATHSDYVCPECGGNLWAVKNEPTPRYRCHTGHVYAEKALLKDQAEKIEESLWVSIRMLEERRNLLLNIAQRNALSENLHARHLEKSEQLNVHINHLKSLLVSLSKRNDEDEAA